MVSAAEFTSGCHAKMALLCEAKIEIVISADVIYMYL